jgi:hypothetical protein
MAFNELKVVPTAKEMMAAASADHIYEAVDAYLMKHSGFSTMNIVGVLAMLGKNHIEDIRKLFEYLFSGRKYGIRGFLDRAMNISWMLERDNDLLAPND